MMPLKRSKRRTPISSETSYHAGTQTHGLGRMQCADAASFFSAHANGFPPTARRFGIYRATLEINNA